MASRQLVATGDGKPPEPTDHASQQRRRSAKGKKPRAAPKKPRKQKAGWGPYRTVMNERAVVFNLTLDVQQLRQEVHSLTVTRNILLEARAVNQRHAPSGSLVRVVEKYYDMLRTGFTIEPENVARRRYTHPAREQCAFLHSVMDHEIDCGGGLFGVDVMIEQLRRYSTFLRFIGLHLYSSDIVVADGSVMITTKGAMHFQILRDTIAGIFPHVLGHEWLVSKLVGREATPAVTLTFYFNALDKVSKYVVDLDFFQTFATLLTDPEDVAILLGRAFIGANNMFGEDVPRQEKTVGGPVQVETVSVDRGFANRQLENPRALVENDQAPMQQRIQTEVFGLDHETRDPVRSIQASHPVEAMRQSHHHVADLAPDYSQVIWRYFEAFSKAGSSGQDSWALSGEQRAFLDECVAPDCEFGDAGNDGIGPQTLAERWRRLTTSFELLGFVQTSQDPLVFQREEKLYFVRVTAQYVLRISQRTIHCVFPHVLPENEQMLWDALLGGVITVPSQLRFWIESDSGAIACVKEKMDFKAALGKFVGDRRDLDWLMEGASLTTYGVYSKSTAPSDNDEGGESAASGDIGEFQRLLNSELTSDEYSLLPAALPPGSIISVHTRETVSEPCE